MRTFNKNQEVSRSLMQLLALEEDDVEDGHGYQV